MNSFTQAIKYFCSRPIRSNKLARTDPKLCVRAKGDGAKRTARHETGRREVNISKNVSVRGLILNLYYFDTIWLSSSSREYFVF